MDFGDLLDEWERLSAKPGGLDRAREAERRALEEEGRRAALRRAEEARRAKERAKARYSLEAWLEEHGTEDKDSAAGEELGAAREGEARRLRDKRPEARLDLHGMSQAEAEAALGAFLERSGRAGLEKVLVVTGKGNHSKEGPVLGRAARRVLEANPWAGRFGTAGPSDGGSGALWVLIRRGLISRGR